MTVSASKGKDVDGGCTVSEGIVKNVLVSGVGFEGDVLLCVVGFEGDVLHCVVLDCLKGLISSTWRSFRLLHCASCRITPFFSTDSITQGSS